MCTNYVIFSTVRLFSGKILPHLSQAERNVETCDKIPGRNVLPCKQLLVIFCVLLFRLLSLLLLCFVFCVRENILKVRPR